MQKLERAEVNPKKRVTICSYDSSSDIFKVTTIRQETLISSTYCSADKPGLQRPEGERPRVEVDHQSDQVGRERNSEPTFAAREADILAAGQRPGQHGEAEVRRLPRRRARQPEGVDPHPRLHLRGDVSRGGHVPQRARPRQLGGETLLRPHSVLPQPCSLQARRQT